MIYILSTIVLNIFREDMAKGLLEKRNVTPEQAVKILRKKGVEVNESQAKVILDFLYILAKLTVNQYFKNK
uniref:Uncharacterized protein n=2 Tax=Sphingobacteriaceae TaxID=84566 RepID=F4CEL0_SPHS2